MDIQQAKKSRTTRRTNILKLIAKLTDSIKNKNFGEVGMSLAQLIAKETALSEVTKRIELLTDAGDLETEIEDNETFSDHIIGAKFKAEQFLATAFQPPAAAAASFSPTSARSSKVVKLPKLRIEKFDGSFSDWERFWDQFSAGVHSNQDLSKVDKFNYLKGFLSREAAETIQGLNLTEVNYDIAQNLLQQKYGNKEVLVNEHVNSLLKTKAVQPTASGQDLRRLFEDFQKHIRAINALGQDVASMGLLLCPILLQAIPSNLLLEWNRQTRSKSNNDLPKLLDFIQQELEGIEQAWRTQSLKEPQGIKQREEKNYTEAKKQPYMNNTSWSKPSSASTLLVSGDRNEKGRQIFCAFCESTTHSSTSCSTVSSNEARRAALRRTGRCFNCLRKRHQAKQCRIEIRCRTCQGSHHTLLCFKRERNQRPESKPIAEKAKATKEDENSAIATVVNHANNNQPESRTARKKGTSILQTIRLWIKHSRGTQQVTCLIDGGSEKSFILSSVVKDLQLPTSNPEQLKVNSFGGRSTRQTSNIVLFTLCNQEGMELAMDAFEVDEICNGVAHWETGRIEMFLNQSRRIPWSQTMGNGERISIDLLIGADWYWRIMTGHMKRIDSYLMATQSIFGWMLQGRGNTPSCNRPVVMMHSSLEETSETTTDKLLQTFWELDQAGIMAKEEISNRILLDQQILDEFATDTTFRNGRYQVRIPWADNKDSLSRNYRVAEERLRRLLTRLNKEPALFQRYKKGIYEYLEEGHTEEVASPNLEGKSTYYMPHQPVIKEDRKTTKLRIVFDASSHEKGQASLNDCQNTGPNLNPNIIELLLRFRRHRIGITSDIKKAFLQIELHPDDRDATRFLWKDEEAEPQQDCKTFRMTRVPFGMKSSPFLLAATIRLHAKTNLSHQPEVAKMIDENFYVDDLLSGEDSTEAAYQIYRDTRDVMHNGGFELTKWATNDKQLLQRWKTEEVVSQTQPIELLKVLGLMWNSSTDHLTYKTANSLDLADEVSNTKRGILGLTARLFDPLGFLVPKLITAKCMLQDLWRSKCHWDKAIPDQLQTEWQEWKDDLKNLRHFTIPRWCSAGKDLSQSSQLHVFCDAAPKAYGAVAYLRTTQEGQSAIVTLIASKSRVAPIKLTSIPRLELLACLTGARLAQTIREAWNETNIPSIMWTDSCIVLQWVQSVPSKWKIFVGKRIQEIQSLATNSEWRHCPSKENIADIISRGQTLKILQQNENWWHGPKWLSQNRDDWPQPPKSISRMSSTSEEEIKATTVASVTENHEKSSLFDYKKHHSWKKIIRITGWMIRFVTNCRVTQEQRQTNTLTAKEIDKAEMIWLCYAQQEGFSKEVSTLAKKRELETSSSIYQFHPFMDDKGLMRLGGRLKFAPMKEGLKHPIILRSGELTNMLILDRHVKTIHGGVQSTLIKLREKVWIIQGRQATRKVIQGCMQCRRWSVKPASMNEAPLPTDRISQTNPFEITGLDHAGPLWLKEDGKQVKGYICLFTCAVTRAIHLELASSQGTKPFLLALRRFVARRGCCKTIYSDNAQTFKQANRLLEASWQNITHKEVQDFVAHQGVEWKFIPPRAAWWGGFYERLVGSVKRHLRRVLGNALLQAEEMATILVEIEAAINSRPLTNLSEDPDDRSSLTPFHFLLGKTAGTLPDMLPGIVTMPAKEPLLRKWKFRKRLMDSFWKQWKEEYLLQLKTAHQVKNPRRETVFKIDDVVLLGERVPRGQWKMARVIELKEGRDGKTRSVLVKTAKGDTMRRAIQHVYPLEIS